MTEAPSSPESPREESLDARLVRELADVLNQTGLTEIEVERADIKIRVAKTLTAAAAPAAVIAHPVAAPVAQEAAAPVAAPAAPVRSAGDTIKSPMVGTVYLQPQPGAPPFIKVGDRVSQGQTLLLIEAMKTMNPISAPTAGVVLEILVGDSQPVEYGEPLAVIG